MHPSKSGLGLVIGLLLTFAIPGLADFDAGWKAFLADDYSGALRELKPLAQEGNPQAQEIVGAMYDKGLGVKADKAEAASWYGRAAEKGDANAQGQLGEMYRIGQGVPRDYSQALKWCQKSTDQDNAFGEWCLGRLYYDETGVTQDYPRAFQLFSGAAYWGMVLAQQWLALMYLEGQGVPKDLIHAHMWNNLAAHHGSDGARVTRDTIAREMTREQIVEAERLAVEWRPGKSPL